MTIYTELPLVILKKCILKYCLDVPNVGLIDSKILSYHNFYEAKLLRNPRKKIVWGEPMEVGIAEWTNRNSPERLKFD